jgi:hypothetical protein
MAKALPRRSSGLAKPALSTVNQFGVFILYLAYQSWLAFRLAKK